MALCWRCSKPTAVTIPETTEDGEILRDPQGNPLLRPLCAQHSPDGKAKAKRRAALTKAAPELLDRLRMTLAALEDLRPWPPETSEHIAVVCSISRDSISKAEGKS